MADAAPSPIAQDWRTDEDRAAQMAAALVYKGVVGGLEQMHRRGQIVLQPQGERVLLCAILQTDAYELGLGGYDARQAIAHEIVAFGPGCYGYWDGLKIGPDQRPKIGQHCFVSSAAADRVSKTDKACRFWTAHIKDVSAVWDVPLAGA